MRLFAVLLAVAAMTSCYRHVYSRPVGHESMPRMARWNHHFLWGLVAIDPEVNLDAVCPGGIARVENYIGPLGFLLGAVTVGIWVPTTVTVWCAAGGPPVGVDLRTGKITKLPEGHSGPPR